MENKMKKMCVGCGKSFETNYPQSKFCSKDCKLTSCVICGNSFENPRRNRKTCSHVCKGIYQSRYQRGENNPNYGKTWDTEQRKSQSKLVKSKVDEQYRLKAGSANRGKKFSQERIDGMHGHRDFHSYSRPHSDESKMKIGKQSAKKFTDEYKRAFRHTMEVNGNWIPLHDKPDSEIYFKESDWIDNMFDIVEDGLTLLNEYGIFNSKSNTGGVVRDHIVGRKYGFEHRVFPEIIRHPANCNIILHRDNVSKGQKGKGRPDTDMSIENLFSEIRNFSGEWKEHEKVIELIGEYENGKRWKRKEAKCVSESE